MVREENKLFYVGMKAFIAKADTLLIVRQSQHYADSGKWQLPGGRIAHGEEGSSLESILLREIKEECGEIKISVGDIIHVFRRQFASGEWVFLVGFDCQYLSGEVELNEESTEYAWIRQEDIDRYEFVNGYQEAIEVYFSKKK